MSDYRFDSHRYDLGMTSTRSGADTICCPPMFRSPITEEQAIDLADVLKAMADPARLRLISMIASAPDGEACACDLAEPLGRSQPTVSHHLSQLVKAGLITREQRGKWAWFRLNAEPVAELCDCLSLSAS
jgi:ArsR family transcriptional regulator